MVERQPELATNVLGFSGLVRPQWGAAGAVESQPGGYGQRHHDRLRLRLHHRSQRLILRRRRQSHHLVYHDYNPNDGAAIAPWGW